jgi:cell division protein FtsW
VAPCAGWAAGAQAAPPRPAAGRAGAALLYLQKSGAPAGAGVMLATAWAALWCAWLAAGRSLAARAGILLLALGLLAQLDMGLGAPESSWLRHAGKTGALLAIGAGACGLFAALRPIGSTRPLPQARVELGLLLLTGAALMLLVLQVVFGDETGVFDLQPVEFAKLTLAALSAHCLALAAGAQPAPGGACCGCCAWARRRCCSWCCWRWRWCRSTITRP